MFSLGVAIIIFGLVVLSTRPTTRTLAVHPVSAKMEVPNPEKPPSEAWPEAGEGGEGGGKAPAEIDAAGEEEATTPGGPTEVREGLAAAADESMYVSPERSAATGPPGGEETVATLTPSTVAGGFPSPVSQVSPSAEPLGVLAAHSTGLSTPSAEPLLAASADMSPATGMVSKPVLAPVGATTELAPLGGKLPPLSLQSKLPPVKLPAVPK